MTPRPVPEWIGKTPLSKIPRDAKDRILLRFDDACADCGRAFGPHLKVYFDHRPALCNGGQNRESMIEPVCGSCHRDRSGEDARIRAATLRLRANYFGTKTPSRHPVPGSKNTKWAKRYNRETGRFETVRRKN